MLVPMVKLMSYVEHVNFHVKFNPTVSLSSEIQSCFLWKVPFQWLTFISRLPSGFQLSVVILDWLQTKVI